MLFHTDPFPLIHANDPSARTPQNSLSRMLEVFDHVVFEAAQYPAFSNFPVLQNPASA
jgi:hypothetical protein